MTLPAGYRFHHQGWYYKTENGEGPFFITPDGAAHQGLEPRYMTDANGPYARLRVDTGQTGFFAGREFRTFYEFSIASGASLVIKVVAPLDTIVQMFGADLYLAELRIELRAGGTEGGTFDTALPVIPANSMSSASGYGPQVTMAAGGTHTGGAVYDLLLLYSGANPNKATAQSATEASPQGFAAGTYYIVLQNTDGNNAEGIFRARWEERPVGV
jgi:hypothetical protein